LVKDLTVVKSLQSEFEKAGNRRTRKAEISEKQARAEQDRLVENWSACRKLVEDERKEKKELVRQSRKAVAELCEAKLQQSNVETAARRRARQAESAISSAKKSRDMLTQAKSTQTKLHTRLERLKRKRKLEKQTERRKGVMGGGSAMTSTDTAGHNVKLLEAEAVRYTSV
jgi:hypothetical protein